MEISEKIKKNYLMVIFYLNKLTEGGFVSLGQFEITPKGFDMAMDLKETGHIVSKESIKNICDQIIPHDADKIACLVFGIQDMGLKAMLKICEEKGFNETNAIK